MTYDEIGEMTADALFLANQGIIRPCCVYAYSKGLIGDSEYYVTLTFFEEGRQAKDSLRDIEAMDYIKGLMHEYMAQGSREDVIASYADRRGF